eukprot:scaffold2668_cov115-Isochrysis_galbana.AAC.11
MSRCRPTQCTTGKQLEGRVRNATKSARCRRTVRSSLKEARLFFRRLSRAVACAWSSTGKGARMREPGVHPLACATEPSGMHNKNKGRAG